MQVGSRHYFNQYDDLQRFISYFYQIHHARELKPGSILEAGVGNKTVANYLKAQGYAVTTCDFDLALKPSSVGDVRHLPFEEASFDLVLACEILEHLPWEDVSTALSEIRRVTRKYAILSLPCAYKSSFELLLGFPFLYRFFGKTHLHFAFRLPFFSRAKCFDGQHYWEIGRKGFPKKKIRDALVRNFKIIQEVDPVLNLRQIFFVLEKR
jgi:hypothetical protein